MSWTNNKIVKFVPQKSVSENKVDFFFTTIFKLWQFRGMPRKCWIADSRSTQPTFPVYGHKYLIQWLDLSHTEACGAISIENSRNIKSIIKLSL